MAAAAAVVVVVDVVVVLNYCLLLLKLSNCLLLLLLLLLLHELALLLDVVVVLLLLFLLNLSLLFVLHQNETLYEDKKPFHTTICTVLCSRSIAFVISPTLVSARNSKPISFYP